MDLAIWLNATVVNFQLAQDTGRLTSVSARHISGKALIVSGSNFALCAGALKSTRLLLLLDQLYNGAIFQDCEAIGRYFHDHVSMPVAAIQVHDKTRLNRLAAFRFVGGTMRSLRFELSPRAQKAAAVASGFAHIGIRTTEATGFEALRRLLRNLQLRGRIDPRLVLEITRDFPFIARAAFWRYLRHQLYWPASASPELHVVAEQLPHPDNRITLSATHDMLGVPIPTIDWQIRPTEHRVFAAFKERFSAYWNRHSLDGVGSLSWSEESPVLPLKDDEELSIFHPGGSTRMGSDRRLAVVDHDLRLFAVRNLWVASTSVFPSGASANPTLMLMLFARRLGHRLAAEARIRPCTIAPIAGADRTPFPAN